MHADRAILSALALASVLAGAPAAACTLTITTGGALDLSDDHTQLGSQIKTGHAATLTTILPLLSGVTVDVDAPTVYTAPAGYNYSTSTTEAAYTASVIGVVTLKTQPYTTSSSSFQTGVLGAVTVTIVMHNRITNTSGFPSGSYKSRTIITCHP